MIGEVETVHGTREIQIAVRIEDPHEFFGLRFEVTLHRKARRERARAQRIAGDGLAPETLAPLGGRAVGDGAELAGQAHAVTRRLFRRVVAALPVRIPQHRFALHRAQGDRVGRSGRRA